MSEFDLTGNPVAVNLQDAGCFQLEETKASRAYLKIGVHYHHRFRLAGFKIEGTLQQYSRKCQCAVGMDKYVTFAWDFRMLIGNWFRRYLLIFRNEKMIIKITRVSDRLQCGQHVREHDPA